MLEALARMISADQRVRGFKGSAQFIQKCARLYNMDNVSLWGTGSSADVDEAAAHTSENRAELAGSDPERIYNFDATGLFSLCIPNHGYGTAGQCWRARGLKAMKAKDRFILVLLCRYPQDTGSNDRQGWRTPVLQATSPTLPPSVLFPVQGGDGWHCVQVLARDSVSIRCAQFE